MKALVECTIENIGHGRRLVRFAGHHDLPKDGNVAVGECRLISGQPCPADWPPLRDTNRVAPQVPGLVEAEVVVPALILVQLGPDQFVHVRILAASDPAGSESNGHRESLAGVPIADPDQAPGSS